MKQALHIFKKDAGHLRLNVAISLLAAAIFCATGMHSPRGPGPTAFILPAVWWFLIARVVHSEPLPGRGHFWLTRPYQWRNLLAAKLLFVLTFVNLPLFIADIFILYAAGFTLSAQIPGLLWTQVLLTAVFVIPAMLISALTRELAEFLVVTLFLVIAVGARLLLGHTTEGDSFWAELEWVKSYYFMTQVFVVASILLVYQYARRNTRAVRTLTCAAVAALLFSTSLLPWTAAFALQRHFSQKSVDISAVHIELDQSRTWLAHIYFTAQDQAVAELPLRVSGLPAGVEFRPNGMSLTLLAPDGEKWIVDQPALSSFDFEAGILSLRAVVGKAFYDHVKDLPLEIRGKLYFTLYGNPRRIQIPLQGNYIPVLGVGTCAAAGLSLQCNSAFRPQPNLASIQISEDSPRGLKTTTESLSRPSSDSPFPADLNINPLFVSYLPRQVPVRGATVETSEPLAFVDHDFTISNVQLSKFAANSVPLPSN